MGMCCISFCCPVYFCGGGITAASTRLCCNKNLGKEKFPSCCQLTTAICLFFGLIMYIIVTIECTNAMTGRSLIILYATAPNMGYYPSNNMWERDKLKQVPPLTLLVVTGLGPGCKQYFKPSFLLERMASWLFRDRCFSYRGI